VFQKLTFLSNQNEVLCLFVLKNVLTLWDTKFELVFETVIHKADCVFLIDGEQLVIYWEDEKECLRLQTNTLDLGSFLGKRRRPLLIPNVWGVTSFWQRSEPNPGHVSTALLENPS
jgi:hypothetical protein